MNLNPNPDPDPNEHLPTPPRPPQVGPPPASGHRRSDARLRPPALAETLAYVLPTPDQTLLLRACLQSGTAGREAWRVWRARAGEPKQVLREDGGGVRRLPPLLFAALRRNGIVEPDGALTTLLRTAYLREELRNATFFRIFGQVVSALAAADIPAIVLRGAALGGTVYGDPALRHAHDVDLLLRRADLARAAPALSSLGFRPYDGSIGPPADVGLAHPSGLPLVLHSYPFRLPYGNALLAELWARSRIEPVAGAAARLLAPADALLHVCGHAASAPGRAPLLWACDAWHLIERRPDLDWHVLVESARRGHLALPLSIMLRYLAVELEAPIPATVLRRIDAAAEADALGREAALFAARTWGGRTFRSMLRDARGLRARGLILKWMLLPSPAYLRALGNVRRPELLPLYYLYRPLRYGARRLTSRLIVRHGEADSGLPRR